MVNYDVSKLDGTKSGSTELSDAVFGIESNNGVLFEAINLQRAPLRQGTRAVKNRSTVSGGGCKPWKQKGIGCTHQGTIRAPQWYGGGIASGPTPRSYAYKMPKKMCRLALRSASFFKAQENGLAVANALNSEVPKAKEFRDVLSTLEQPKKALVVTKNKDVDAELSVRNTPGVQVTAVQGLNVLDITNADSLVITEVAAKKVEEVLG